MPTPPPLATTHVQVWTYYGANNVATNVPASWMAAHATYAMTTAATAGSFKAAGGRYAVTYFDPVDVIVANHEPFWDTPETGWFHDASGARIARQFGTAGTQNSLNPTSPIVVSEFQAATAARAASAPFDFAEVDDVSFDRLNAFYNFTAPGVEVATDAAYDAGVQQLLQSSAIPPIFNGLHNADAHLDSYSGNTMFLPYARGGLSENCFWDVTGPRKDRYWSFDVNTMLATTGQGKIAVCEGANAPGTAAVAPRLFFLASWWMTYDPTYSVAFPGFSSGSLVWVFPEYDIVPTQPVQTASTASALQAAGGAFVREFAACYQAGAYVGRCAAIVNPSSSATVSLPAFPTAYHRSLALDPSNQYDGGQASWVNGIPTTLGPTSAAILTQ